MLKLVADKREIFGKALKPARGAGNLPVVVYGRAKKGAKPESHSYFINTKDFSKVLKAAGESTIVTLESPDGDHDILIKEVSFHPTSGEPIHADLYLIDKTKKLEVEVPLIFEGLAPAVKELGGIVLKVMHELPVEALPKDLPHDIKVDLTKLVALDSQILVKDLDLPVGVEAKVDMDEVVASITVAVEEPEVVEPIDLTAIEVEKKGKTEVEGESESSGETKEV
ncbi:MAG: 50S ribosomal protein L25 [bacterium]|nr:50S ribosomal protein L25 [bacterium]